MTLRAFRDDLTIFIAGALIGAMFASFIVLSVVR